MCSHPSMCVCHIITILLLSLCIDIVNSIIQVVDNDNRQIQVTTSFKFQSIFDSNLIYHSPFQHAFAELLHRLFDASQMNCELVKKYMLGIQCSWIM